jgi:hypothetical protein
MKGCGIKIPLKFLPIPVFSLRVVSLQGCILEVNAVVRREEKAS